MNDAAGVTIAEYVLIRLEELGCRHVFGVPGTSCASLYATMEGRGGVAAVVTTNELEAGYAADGYARFAGFGACCVAYGVGTLSLINAIAGALVEKVPLVVLNGGPSKDELDAQDRYGVLFSHSTGRADLDYRLFREVTVSARIIGRDDDIAAAIDGVLHDALAGLGPVYLELPNDLWLERVDAPAAPLPRPSPPAPGPEFDAFVAAATARAQAAASPAILLGVELVRHGLKDATLRLIEATGFPFATDVLSKSFVPESHPQFRGTYDTDLVEKPVRTLLESSDCLIALGCVFGVDHLTLVRKQYDNMISVASDSGRIGGEQSGGVPLAAFVEAFRPAHAGARKAAAPDGYASSYAARRESWAPSPPPPTDEARNLTHEALFTTIDEFLHETHDEFITVLDTCLGSFPGADLVMRADDAYAANPVWLSIGHGTPAATGVHFATGRRPLMITGDGGFQMVAQSVSTMVKYRIPAVLVIIDNGCYAIEQYLIEPCYFVKDDTEPLPFAALHHWRYDALPELFGGGRSEAVYSAEAMAAALRNARHATDGPFIIRALVPPNDLPPESVAFAHAQCPSTAELKSLVSRLADVRPPLRNR